MSKVWNTCLLVLLAGLLAAEEPRAQSLPDNATMRAWIEEMKVAPRGPFRRIAWFCEDGTVLGPRQGCSRHGGGIQHGEWNAHAMTLREGGFAIANILAALEPGVFSGPAADRDLLRQILLERYLMAADDGWVLRVVKTYRGSVQAGDEEEAATRILGEMLTDSAWLGDDQYYLLRETVRYFPRSGEATGTSASEVRQMSTRIARADRGFESFRVKLHGAPDASDAEAIRAYASERGRSSLMDSYLQLASDVDVLYGRRGAADALRKAAAALPHDVLRDQLEARAELLQTTNDPTARLANASDLVAVLRERSSSWQGAGARRAMLEASLALEDEVYVAGNELAATLPSATRRQRLEWVWYLASGLYGSGLLSASETEALRESIRRLAERGDPSANVYRTNVAHLSRASDWASRTISRQMGRTVEHFATLDPQARLYPQERLRASGLLFYASVTDSLSGDSRATTMVRNELFGTPVGSSLRALNPGLARGVLRIPGWRERRGEFDRAGIYLLPETIAELPPIAGILTQGEGSSLSHVQLLARNLAIPNVVVGSEIIQRIRSRVGDTIVLAVSPGGVVQVAADGPRWDAVFGREGKPSLRLRPDLEKLDLDSAEIVPLSELTADDSGRIVGPKSANLGELKQAFGAAVPDGVVIPFGVFRRLLEQPMNPGGPSVFRWMAGQYSSLRALRGDHEAQEKATREFLTRLRAWIESSDPGPEFRAELESALREHFGPDGTYGVFVRSDTNVEDLPNFTGAGLNLTVPNVVGEQAIYDAIRRVWASPFTERAFSWRQAHMDRPLYVFPAVLVQRAFPSEKSGVMVTKDVQGGRPGWLTVAVNEGVGGVVDGQAAESLLVREDGSEATLLSSASARTQRVLAPTGGIEEIPTSGRGRILEPREAARLAQVARLAPERFDTLRDEDGEAIPADIEFAFAGGRMAILQIRPFVESKSAQENEYLMSLDARTKGDEEEDDDEGRVRLDSSAAGGRRW